MRKTETYAEIAYPNSHPVLEELQRRIHGETPQHKLALAIEGGGMRSVTSAGMARTLEENGIGPQYFDAVFGASGGAFNAAYYVAGQASVSEAGYWENTGKELINVQRFLSRRGPMINMGHMIRAMVEAKPLDFDTVLASKKLRVMATNIRTGNAVAFEPPRTKEELLRQLRAGSAVPKLGSQAIRVNDKDYLDAGIAERVPLETPIALGYDAILILATQPVITAPSAIHKQMKNRVLNRGLGRLSPELAKLVLQDPKQKLHKAQRLKQMTESPTEPPYALVISPDISSKPVGRLELEFDAIRAGAMVGSLAVQKALRLTNWTLLPHGITD